MKTTTKPVHLFAPITRVNDEERTIEALAFVNEVVPGEGGVRLTRASMEAATPDYMQWANIRRMHQPDAVGVAESVTWGDKGAAMVLKVVDDDAWEKVKNRVYKGLSVGVVPTVMRGKDVVSCRWIETSLVDRPKDPDAVITMVRAEGVDPEAETEVEVLDEETPAERAETVEQPEELDAEPAAEPEGEEPAEERTETPEWTEEQAEAFRERLARLMSESGIPQAIREDMEARLSRAMTSADVPSRENLEGGVTADTHYSCGNEYGCCGHTTRGGAQECMDRQQRGIAEQIAHLEEHLNGLKARQRAEMGEEALERAEDADDPSLLDPATTPATELLARVESIPAGQFTTFATTILTRLETAESGLAEEQQKRTAAEERAEALAKQPAVVAPVRFPQALERTHAHLREQYPDLSKLDDEIQRAEADGLKARDAGDEAEALRCVDRLQRLKMQRAALVPAQS